MKQLMIFSVIVLLCMNYSLLRAEEDSISENETLKAGVPFKHTVEITRSGRILRLNFKVIGSDGKEYDIRELTNNDYAIKPSVEIYKGDLLVGSGSFEYG